MIHPYSEYSEIEIAANLLLREFVKTEEFKSFREKIDALTENTGVVFSGIMINPCYEMVLDDSLNECEWAETLGDSIGEFDGLGKKSASDLYDGEQSFLCQEE